MYSIIFLLFLLLSHNYVLSQHSPNFPILLSDSTTLTVNNSTATLYFHYNATDRFFTVVNYERCNATEVEYGIWECNYRWPYLFENAVWPIYYSLNGLDYTKSEYNVSHFFYNATYTNSVQFVNNFDLDTTDSLAISGISLWIVVVGILTTFTVVFTLIILRMYYPYEINSFLYHIDYLHINIYGDIPITDDHNVTGEIKIGMGVEVKQRTSVLGGFLTIIIGIISAFTITSYFYDSLSNNTQYISTFSINSNNVIPSEQSFINIKLNYVNVLGSNSDVWTTKMTGLNNGITEVVKTPVLGNSIYNYTVLYKCIKCSVDIGNNAQYIVKGIGGNFAYTMLEYNIQTNSYSGTNQISGSYTTEGVFVGDNALSISVVPTSYVDQYGAKQTGFLLDYQNGVLGAHYTMSEYEKYLNDPDISEISTTINFSRNPSWYNIVQSVKYTQLIVFSQLFAIIGGISTFSLLLYNICASKTVRRLLSCRKYRNEDI
jgi:hypothetical protein